MSACIAGIGARKTPKHILDLMAFIGLWCLENNIFVRTGHADGADYAFECGAQTNTICYIPWASFNRALPFKTKHIVVWDEVANEPRARALANVDRHHPAPHKLGQAVKKLMARNYFQLAGSRVGVNWVSAVVCWTKGGKGHGGTGQAIRIANDNNIPVLDLGSKAEWELDEVTSWLEAAIGQTEGQTE